jgi:hypothetical protein
VDVPLHPDVEPLAFLLGTWRGGGSGEYPTIEPFDYDEELEFANVGKAYLTYRQRTWRIVEGVRAPSHMELAFWRPAAGRLEVTSAHPNGVVEVEVGTIGERTVELTSSSVATAPSAKEVTRVERRFSVDGDVLRYEVMMAAVGRDLGPHLRAELVRVHGSPRGTHP